MKHLTDDVVTNLSALCDITMEFFVLAHLLKKSGEEEENIFLNLDSMALSTDRGQYILS